MRNCGGPGHAVLWRRALALALLGGLLTAGGCVEVPPPPQSAPPPPTQADRFAAFVQQFRVEALAAGIAPEVYDAAMSKAQLSPRVRTRNRSQPEFEKPIWAYLDTAVSATRVSEGRARFTANAAELTAMQTRFGVPAEILVSIWGVETEYGQVLGSNYIFSVLGTLALDPDRALYARPQLIAALRILQERHYPPARMVSSWAGAFGQTQFVPSTFLDEAVDGDGDGKIDMWGSYADALASTAHLLVDYGWEPGQPWGYEIRLPDGFRYADADLAILRPVDAWAKAGIVPVSGGPLTGDGEAAIFLPAGRFGPAYLVLANFRTLMRYNHASSYALAVCLLADRIVGRPGPKASWPRNERPLSRAERLELQQDLKTLGYYSGQIDGIIGNMTRFALRAWQQAQGLPADGFATSEVLGQLQGQIAVVPSAPAAQNPDPSAAPEAEPAAGK